MRTKALLAALVLMNLASLRDSNNRSNHLHVAAFQTLPSFPHATRSHRQKKKHPPRLSRPIQPPPYTADAPLTSLNLSPAPSGVDQLPLFLQAGIFVAIFASLGGGTLSAVSVIDSWSQNNLERWRTAFIETSLPLLIGTLYLSAGSGHFLATDAFCDIFYPPPGTWGIWYLPGSASFHVAWTGVAECLGGSGLLISGVRAIFDQNDDDETFLLKLIQPLSALLLFVLTLAVTPANIFMYTHGATMGDTGPLDLSFHYIRFGFQVLFLSLLWVMAKDSFFFAWGDELD